MAGSTQKSQSFVSGRWQTGLVGLQLLYIGNESPAVTFISGKVRRQDLVLNSNIQWQAHSLSLILSTRGWDSATARNLLASCRSIESRSRPSHHSTRRSRSAIWITGATIHWCSATSTESNTIRETSFTDSITCYNKGAANKDWQTIDSC